MMRSLTRLRSVAATFLAVAVLTGVSVLAAPAASATPYIDVKPSETHCGWTTCTHYWSVSRSQDLKNDLAGVIGETGIMIGTAAGAGALLGPGGAAAGAAFGVMQGANLAAFRDQVNNAAGKGRCVIYKYPRATDAAGWWGTVSVSNDYCD